MDRKDFMAKFRAGFNKTSEDEERVKMNDRAADAAKKKRKKEEDDDGESKFSKIYKSITGRK